MGRSKKDQIKKDMLDQLEFNGTVGAHYSDLVENYVKYWVMQAELLKDIDERGAKVTKLDSRGQWQVVNNESIDQMLKIHRTMLAILNELGIHAVDGDSVSGDIEDEL